jgi:hypothetical protein
MPERLLIDEPQALAHCGAGIERGLESFFVIEIRAIPPHLLTWCERRHPKKQVRKYNLNDTSGTYGV